MEKTDTIHLSARMTETEDIEIQCQMETKSVDSKAHKDLLN